MFATILLWLMEHSVIWQYIAEHTFIFMHYGCPNSKRAEKLQMKRKIYR